MKRHYSKDSGNASGSSLEDDIADTGDGLEKKKKCKKMQEPPSESEDISFNELSQIFDANQLRYLVNVSNRDPLIDRIMNLVNIADESNLDSIIQSICTVEDNPRSPEEEIETSSEPGCMHIKELETFLNADQLRHLNNVAKNGTLIEIDHIKSLVNIDNDNSLVNIIQSMCSLQYKPSCLIDLNQSSGTVEINQPGCSNTTQPSCQNYISPVEYSIAKIQSDSPDVTEKEQGIVEETSEPEYLRQVFMKLIHSINVQHTSSQQSNSDDMSRPGCSKDISQPSTSAAIGEQSSSDDKSVPFSSNTCVTTVSSEPLNIDPESFMSESGFQNQILNEIIGLVGTIPQNELMRLLNANSVIFECKICQHLERTLPSFLLHKRTHCRLSAVPSETPKLFRGSIKKGKGRRRKY